jgi:uncharacterized LabA/DUF88 family protein
MKDVVAYIDGANLRMCTNKFVWKLDYRRLRIWLLEKYKVRTAYLFLGFVPQYKNLYRYLQDSGYELIFKQVAYGADGKLKGNCDADLVVSAMKDFYENVFDKAILVSSDGDYTSLVLFLLEKNKLQTIVSPAPPSACSLLLKRTGAKIAYLSDQKHVLSALNEKSPDQDET